MSASCICKPTHPEPAPPPHAHPLWAWHVGPFFLCPNHPGPGTRQLGTACTCQSPPDSRTLAHPALGHPASSRLSMSRSPLRAQASPCSSPRRVPSHASEQTPAPGRERRLRTPASAPGLSGAQRPWALPSGPKGGEGAAEDRELQGRGLALPREGQTPGC